MGRRVAIELRTAELEADQVCAGYQNDYRQGARHHSAAVSGPCGGRGAIYGRACPSRKMVKRKERKMAEQYIEQLAAARERIVADRRELADELAKPYERGRYEQWRRIIEVQATIDAIDRAITDERSIKDKGKPVSLVDPG